MGAQAFLLPAAFSNGGFSVVTAQAPSGTIPNLASLGPSSTVSVRADATRQVAALGTALVGVLVVVAFAA
jgi:hypothetical protein